MSGTTLVWGAGAIGGSVGAMLSRAGEKVLFVDNAAAHVAAIERDGLKIVGPLAEFTAKVRAVTPDTLEDSFDRILLCVKCQHTTAAMKLLQRHLAPEGIVVSLQNGLNGKLISSMVGSSRVIGGFVNFYADVLGPGIVHYAGRGSFAVGELDGRQSARLDELVKLLRLFDSEVQGTSNIWGFLWGKLVLLAFLFATALTMDPIADVLECLENRALLKKLAAEVISVAKAEGVRVEAFDGFDPSAFRPESTDAAVDHSFERMVFYSRRSAKTHSGIWRDLAVHKRSTEVGCLLGKVSEVGLTHGIATPALHALTDRIHEIEGARRSQSAALLGELVAVVGALPRGSS